MKNKNEYLDFMNQYLDFLTQLQNEKTKERTTLIADNRKDEAELLKIEVNIIGIFRTTFSALQKLGSDDFDSLYLGKFDSISANWRKNLELAKAHDDTLNVVIEERKIAVCDLLKNQYLAMVKGGSNG